MEPNAPMETQLMDLRVGLERIRDLAQTHPQTTISTWAVLRTPRVLLSSQARSSLATFTLPAKVETAIEIVEIEISIEGERGRKS